MKANELRIGNFLQSDTNIIKIVGVVKKDIYYYHNKKNLYVLELNNFKPIPLTEEWLIKFGFEKKIDCYKNINYNFNGYFASFDCDNPMWFGEDGCCEQVTIKDNIKYVHQLQNLYFAVTGEELTMK
jgi:hypothetical protein